MEFSFGSLELNRTNPSHIGNSPIVQQNFKISQNGKIIPLEPLNKDIHAAEVNGASKSKFESYLLDAVNQVNGQQVEVSELQKKVITDPDSVDIHDVTTAMAKARMSLDLAQTVIERLVSGWNEISQNR